MRELVITVRVPDGVTLANGEALRRAVATQLDPLLFSVDADGVRESAYYDLRLATASAAPAGPCAATDMSLRDYFAGQAVLALGVHEYPATKPGVARFVAQVYHLADALLAARAR